MKHTRKKHPLRFLKNHWIGIVVIILAIAATVGFTYWYETTKSAEIEQTKSESARTLAQLDEKIAEIKAIKAAEEKARKEAAAKETAQQVIETDEQGAGSIDSKTCNDAKIHNNPANIDVLVNKKHCMQPLTYTPGDLVSSRGATLSAKAIDDFNGLMAAADAAGQGVSITSSYRSYSTQVTTYNYWVSMSGAAGADTYSARPGYSEHQTGLAFDIQAGGCALDCFGTTPQYQWMQQHAADYGFIQRYYAGYEAITGYSAEEWHYRYVGKTIAKDMAAKGIKTLEQYWGMPGGDYY